MNLSCVMSKSLLEAVQKSRQEEVLVRLRSGEDVNTRHTLGRTALHCAVSNSNVEAFSTLMMFDPDIEVQDSLGNTALQVAASRSGPGSLEILERLVEAGAKLETVNSRGRSALHEAAAGGSADGVRRLLAAGAEQHNRDQDGLTALQLAAARNLPDLVKLLTPENSGSREVMEVQGGSGTEEVSSTLMTVEEEKSALKKRLAELEVKETKLLGERLKEEKEKLETIKKSFRDQRNKVKEEIVTLEKKIKSLDMEEIKVCKEVSQEIAKLKQDIELSKGINPVDKDIIKALECPVCLDVCKPPKQVKQCPEGHIVCGDCAGNPDLLVCPQCRHPLPGQLSRNRALEDLARAAFPNQPAAAGRSARPGRGQHTGRGRPAAQAALPAYQEQVVNLAHFRPGRFDLRWEAADWEEDEEEDESYDLTAELFLEDIDDEFMPNFPSSPPPPASHHWNPAPPPRLRTARLSRGLSPGHRRGPASPPQPEAAVRARTSRREAEPGARAWGRGRRGRGGHERHEHRQHGGGARLFR